MTAYTLYTETPITRLFFRAALPGAVSMLASALYQLFDGIFVGRFLGETPFAALNLAMPFVIINFAVADLVGVGSSVPISICLGKREDKEANNIFSAACILIVASGAALGAILFLSAPLLIRLMGAEGEFAGLAVQYLRVYALCSPVTTIVFAMDNYLRICGKVRGSMFLNIFMSVLICILEFLFLYVFRWGIWAAALATCLGMGLCAVIALCCFAFGNMQLRFCRPHFSGTMLRQIVTAGSPNFLNNIAGRLTSIIMNIFNQPYKISIVFDIKAVGMTAVYFFGIFLLVLLNNRRKIKKTKVYDLLYADKVNENNIIKTSKGNIIMFIISIVLLIIALISIRDNFMDGSNLSASEIMLEVILIII